MNQRNFSKALWVALLSTGSLFLIELIFSGGYPRGIPVAVFAFLAVMSFIAASALMEGLAPKQSNKFVRLGSILVAGFAIVAWTILFVDQLPCFLGGKGC